MNDRKMRPSEDRMINFCIRFDIQQQLALHGINHVDVDVSRPSSFGRSGWKEIGIDVEPRFHDRHAAVPLATRRDVPRLLGDDVPLGEWREIDAYARDDGRCRRGAGRQRESQRLRRDACGRGAWLFGPQSHTADGHRRQDNCKRA